MSEAGPRHRPRRRFGQHFLHDRAVVARMVTAIAPRAADPMVEIGPGTGVLTAALLEAVERLHAVEIDHDLAASLAHRFAGGGLRVHDADALAFDFAALAPGPSSLRVVGNLPYNVSTPLLFHLLRCRHAIRDMHFMLQREVVARLAAAPGGRDYGRLGVMVQLHCRVTPLFRVGPGAFAPPPRVDSAVVRLEPRARAAVPEEHLEPFARVVAAAFAKRRKTLRNALHGLLDPAQMEAAGVDPARRAQTVAVEEFAALAAAAAAARGGAVDNSVS